jgi:hypothetical protein
MTAAGPQPRFSERIFTFAIISLQEGFVGDLSIGHFSAMIALIVSVFPCPASPETSSPKFGKAGSARISKFHQIASSPDLPKKTRGR